MVTSRIISWLGVLATVCTLTWAGPALALTIKPITWNVVGLDSNDVTAGPNVFPIGARVCNDGATQISADTYDAKFNWVTTNTYISLSSPLTLPIPALAAGACQDIFFEVTITPTKAAYNARAQYTISVVYFGTTTELNPPVVTPSNREIYVEYLVSQNRNAVDGYIMDGVDVAPGGEVTIAVGQTFNLELRAHTATQGYEQLEKFIDLPPSIFRVNKVTSTYSANSGTDPNAGNKIYADGCGWVNDITSPQYHSNESCTGVGKYGGTITQKYNITVIGNPNNLAKISSGALIYDFSGSSYHYNSDYSAGGLTFIFGTPPEPTNADVSIKKVVTGTGGSAQFTLVVTNLGPAEAKDVVVTDPATPGYTVKNANQQSWDGFNVTLDASNNLTWAIGSLASGVSISLPVNVITGAGGLNVANVTSSTPDPDLVVPLSVGFTIKSAIIGHAFR